MSRQQRRPARNPSPVRDQQQSAHGARIDQLFHDAIRDLQELKRRLSDDASK